MTLQNVENFTVFSGADFLGEFKTGLRLFKIAMERIQL